MVALRSEAYDVIGISIVFGNVVSKPDQPVLVEHDAKASRHFSVWSQCMHILSQGSTAHAKAAMLDNF